MLSVTILSMAMLTMAKLTGWSLILTIHLLYSHRSKCPWLYLLLLWLHLLYTSTGWSPILAIPVLTILLLTILSPDGALRRLVARDEHPGRVEGEEQCVHRSWVGVRVGVRVRVRVRVGLG